MSLTYSSYVTSIANLMAVPVSDANFGTMLPNMIDDAELRCYRALNLLDETVRDSSATFTASSRNFTLPTTNGTFINVEQFNVITPAGISSADSGTRNPMTAASKEMIDALWPSSTGSTVPLYFAAVSQDTFIVAPFPDQPYNVEVVGVQRPKPLSVSQATSPLSVFFPDLFIAASMVFATGYQRNFGASVDDPQAGVNWESHYKNLLTDAKTEESRKRFLAVRYQSDPPTPGK
jgi:hypothetical protein